MLDLAIVISSRRLWYLIAFVGGLSTPDPLRFAEIMCGVGNFIYLSLPIYATRTEHVFAPNQPVIAGVACSAPTLFYALHEARRTLTFIATDCTWSDSNAYPVVEATLQVWCRHRCFLRELVKLVHWLWSRLLQLLDHAGVFFSHLWSHQCEQVISRLVAFGFKDLGDQLVRSGACSM